MRPAQKGWQGAMEQRTDSPHEKAFVSRDVVGTTTNKGPYGRGGTSKDPMRSSDIAVEGVVFPATVAQQNRMVTHSLNLDRWQGFRQKDSQLSITPSVTLQDTVCLVAKVELLTLTWRPQDFPSHT